MLKKIFFISSLLLSIVSGAQITKLQKIETYGYEYNRILGSTLLGIPNDTVAVPTELKSYAWVARKSGFLYMWSTTNNKWELIVGGGGGSTVYFGGEDSIATAARYFNLNGKNFTIDSGGIISFNYKRIGFDNKIGLDSNRFDFSLDRGTATSQIFGFNGYSSTSLELNAQRVTGASSLVVNATDGFRLNSSSGILKIDSLNKTTSIDGYELMAKKIVGDTVKAIKFSDILDTTGKWIWAQGNFNAMTRQAKNAWYDSSRHQYLRVVGNDSSNYDWLADNQNGSWALFQGKRLTIRDLDSVTSANDDWPFANNVNGIVERITRLTNTRSTAYRHNLFARQVYEVADSGYVYSIGGDAGSSLHSTTLLTNIPGTVGRQVIQGGTIPFDAVPVFVSTLTTGPKDEAYGISTRRARGYWAPVTSYSNAYAGDTVDHLLYFNATGYDAGAKYLSKTGLYIPIDNNASRTALSWGVYSPDVTGLNSYNLFGGRVGIGDNFGTHTSPSFKSNASFQVNSITRGVIFPRMTAAQRLAISVTSSDSSLIVFDLDSARYMVYTGTAWKGIAWTGEGGGGGGISSLASVGGGLDIQTGGAGNIRTLNTGEFDAATNLISLKTGGIANSKLTNSTISGKSLGSNLDDLTAGFGLLMNTGTTYNGSAAKTERVDTSSAGVASWQKPYQLIDSLKALGWGAQTVQYQPWYQYYYDLSGSTNANMYGASSGTAAAGTRVDAPADNWFGAYEMYAGTATNSFTYMHYGNSGIIMGIAINSSYRYNYGVKLRLSQLSNGTDTYHILSGFSDHNNNYGSAVDAICFRYTNADSSGKWIMCTKSNSTTTEVATSTTVAANTDYELEITVFGGTAYFYINKVLAGSISTNIPTGTSRLTSLANAIRNSAGTGAGRKMWIEWLAYGKRNN